MCVRDKNYAKNTETCKEGTQNYPKKEDFTQNLSLMK